MITPHPRAIPFHSLFPLALLLASLLLAACARQQAVYQINDVDYRYNYYDSELLTKDGQPVTGLFIRQIPAGRDFHTEHTPYKDGKRHGVSKIYYADANGPLLWEFPYVNGLREGVATSYFVEGMVSGTTPYKNGKRDGLKKEYYRNGTLAREKPYVDGQQEGVEKWYYEDGTLRETTSYKNNKRDGPQVSYYANGTIQTEIPYEDDERHGLAKSYDTRGKLNGKALYRKGKLVSASGAAII